MMNRKTSHNLMTSRGDEIVGLLNTYRLDIVHHMHQLADFDVQYAAAVGDRADRRLHAFHIMAIGAPNIDHIAVATSVFV